MDSEKNQIEETKDTEISKLIDRIGLMVEYALELGQLPSEVSIEDFYMIKNQKAEKIGKEQVAQLAKYFEILNRTIAPVTAKTLRNTHPDYIKTSPVGKHLKFIYYLTFFMIGLIFIINFLDYGLHAFNEIPGEPTTTKSIILFILSKFATLVIPFTYGTLGACAYLLRISEKRLHNRTFESRRIPEHRNRIVLGTLCGGVIVMFVKELPGNEGAVLAVTQGALGFIAGYSIDLLFDVIDRIINAILPRVGLDAKEREKIQRKNQMKSEEAGYT